MAAAITAAAQTAAMIHAVVLLSASLESAGSDVAAGVESAAFSAFPPVREMVCSRTHFWFKKSLPLTTILSLYTYTNRPSLPVHLPALSLTPVLLSFHRYPTAEQLK